MDLSYATIPTCENTFVRLNREQEKKYHVEDPQDPMNELVYEMEDLGNYAILSNSLAPVKEKFKEERVDEIWKMNFDGAHSKSGTGAGIVVTSPTEKSFNFAYRLEFEATNNVAEYEALLLGLEIAKDMGIKILKIKGDFDLAILQVKNKFACKNDRLKRYRNAIWDTMEFFDALSLEEVPREMNNKADVLAVSTSTFHPSDELMNGQGKMEVIFRPSIPDNFKHWQVFNDDKQILRFMNNLQEFSDFEVDWKEEGHEYPEGSNPKENPLPKGLISLEQIFDRHDMCKKKKEIVKPGEYIEVNIGSDQDPKDDKNWKRYFRKRKKRLNKSCEKYRDVFSFTYDELKAYNEDVIQHTIPLKEDAKPFRQKLKTDKS
jgi:ribonuclease HI